MMSSKEIQARDRDLCLILQSTLPHNIPEELAKCTRYNQEKQVLHGFVPLKDSWGLTYQSTNKKNLTMEEKLAALYKVEVRLAPINNTLKKKLTMCINILPTEGHMRLLVCPSP